MLNRSKYAAGSIKFFLTTLGFFRLGFFHLGFFQAALAMCVASPQEAGALGSVPDDRWSTIETDHFTIYFDPTFAGDARTAKNFLQRTIASLTEEFSKYEPEKILRKIDCHFYLHPEPNEKASDGRSACITRGLGNGRRHAELHFLTLSRYSPTSRNYIGELKKESHTFYRYIVHEYSSIWLGIIVRSKETGWFVNGKDGPNWFWQGYEEYLGMTLSSAHSRHVTFAKYMAKQKEDLASVKVTFGDQDQATQIAVDRDYANGFTLLAFMHQQFGKEAVQRILVSEKATFWEAMSDSFQMDAAEFHEKYQKWVNEWSNH